jgi:hypothetical protein
MKIASSVWSKLNSIEVRDIIQISKLTRSIEDVEFVANILQKYQRRSDENEVNNDSSLYSYHIRNDNSRYIVNGSSEVRIYCYERGFRDGEEYPFNQNIYDDCGDACYKGFIKVCMSVKGNRREACELATDA